MAVLLRKFFNRSTPEVARDLLGCKLVREINGSILVGLISETEAYQGENDLGCHAHSGRTKRTDIMYGEPGHAYIYFVYGMHWLLNVVTEAINIPAAILLRAIEPIEGMEIMSTNRPQLAYKSGWLNGPAKLTQALKLDGIFNGIDLCSEKSDLRIEPGFTIPFERIETSARVGLFSVPEPWKSIPWRFRIDLHKDKQ